MTFEEWKSGRKYHENLSEIDFRMPNAPGWIYPDKHYIYIHFDPLVTLIYYCININNNCYHTLAEDTTEKYLWVHYSSFNYKTEDKKMEDLNEYVKEYLIEHRKEIIDDYIDSMVEPMLEKVKAAADEFDLGNVIISAFEGYDWNQNIDAEEDFDKIINNI